MTHLLNWLSEYKLLFSLIAGISIVLLTLSVLATPWLIAKLPTNYLVIRQTKQPSGNALKWLVDILQSIIGTLFMLLGLVLMVTPGPGLMVLLIGLSITRFPGKQRLLVYLATQPSVFRSLNWMRQKYDKPPFDAPPTTL